MTVPDQINVVLNLCNILDAYADSMPTRVRRDLLSALRNLARKIREDCGGRNATVDRGNAGDGATTHDANEDSDESDQRAYDTLDGTDLYVGGDETSTVDPVTNSESVRSMFPEVFPGGI